MRSKLRSRAGLRVLLFAVLPACILFLGGAALIRADAVTIVLAWAGVCVAAAISGCFLSYFHSEIFGGGGSLKRLSRKSREESSDELCAVTREEVVSKPDRSMSDNRRNGRSTYESQLDVAVERISRGIGRDLEVRR